MASGTFYPAVSGDDGTWRTGAYYNNQDMLRFGNYLGDPYNTFIRFPSVTIPEGSTVTNAFVRFTSYNSQSETVCNVNVYFNDVDSAVAPISEAGAAGLALTGAVAWNALGAWTDGNTYDTGDISSILQTVISRGGWASGNAVQVLIKDNTSDGSAARVPSAIDHLSGAEKAELHVIWTPPKIGEISEDINVTSEFEDNFGELDEDINVSSEFACLVSDSPISENVSVNSEIICFESDSPISDDVSVNAEFVAEHTGELSEDASINSGAEVIKKSIVEISEDVSINSEFVCYQRPANLDAELPMITADLLGGQGGFLDATLPLITADIKSGAILEASLPVITASLEGKVGAVGNIDATLPKLIADIKGKVETLGNIDAELPAIRAYIVGITGNLATCEATLPMILADIQGVNDLSGDINAILPMIEPYIVGTTERAACPVLRYDDLPDCIGNIAASIPMIEASITEA